MSAVSCKICQRQLNGLHHGRTHNTETTSIRDGGCECGVPNPLHATLDNGDYQHSAIVGTSFPSNLLLMPNRRVNSVLKGMFAIYQLVADDGGVVRLSKYLEVPDLKAF